MENTQKAVEGANGMQEMSWEDDPAAYAAQVHAKYEEEKSKRMRPEGNEQFVPLHSSEKYKHFSDDVWLPADGSVPGYQLQEGKVLHFKFAIQGAGFGGLLYAARLVEAGYKPDDIVLIDYAGGYGGTWYWNRYPGLMCDVESYTYVPLLEETAYMPKHRYSYGKELREHAGRIASTFGLTERCILRSTVKSMSWDEDGKFWRVGIIQLQGKDARQVNGEVTADFVFSISGTLNFPKLPKIPGMDDFKGHQFHTSRFDYSSTGGSEDNPEMVNLKGKRVGIVGTGATAIQLVPHLAKWAKELVVIQRTPSAVDVRDQKPTDPKWYANNCANKPGWQKERMANLAAVLSNENPKEDLVNDSWTKAPSYCALLGTPVDVPPTPEAIGAHVAEMHELDFPRSEKVRRRVDEIVTDKTTASKLKSWYPAWCKRPCFHDEYLPTFNQEHVKLADTAGKGIEKITEDGVVVDGKEYKIDILIWSTGFALLPGPQAHPLLTVKGRGGKTLVEHWSDGMATLHGVLTSDFPNFFFPGPIQGAATSNMIYMQETFAEHSIHMIKQAEKQSSGQKVLIEPKVEAEQTWAMRVAGTSTNLASMGGCTPGYLTAEGMMANISKAPPEEQMKAAKYSTWGRGMTDFRSIIGDWRSKGDMDGLTITVAS